MSIVASLPAVREASDAWVEDEKYRTAVSRTLTAARAELGMTVREMAAFFCVGADRLTSWEAATDVPTLDELAHFLDRVSPQEAAALTAGVLHWRLPAVNAHVLVVADQGLSRHGMWVSSPEIA